VLYGDVTGNWQPVAAEASVAETKTLSRDEQAAIPVDMPRTRATTARDPAIAPAEIWAEGLTTPLRPGERRDVTIHVDRADGILGLDLTIERVAIVGVSSTGIASGWGVAHSGDRLAAFGLTPLAGSGAVLTVTVEGRAGAAPVKLLRIAGTANEGRIPLRSRLE
jgi:hypothetical protein